MRNRSRGLREELEFWEQYIASRGLEWPEEFAARTAPELELGEGQILARLPEIPDPVRVLDVGAGPLTVLGTRAGSRRVELVAVDPLADDYDAILAAHGVRPAVRTIRGEGERLSAMFPAGSFDFAYARNSLDHTSDPFAVIREMLIVVKRDRWVILRHRPNEAVTASYSGLHQWNICAEKGELVLWNDRVRHNLNAELSGVAQIECAPDGEWLVFVLRKVASFDKSAGFLKALSKRIRNWGARSH